NAAETRELAPAYCPRPRSRSFENLSGGERRRERLDLPARCRAEGLGQPQLREGIALVFRALQREAAEHHARDATRGARYLRRHGADRDTCGPICRKPVD